MSSTNKNKHDAELFQLLTYIGNIVYEQISPILNDVAYRLQKGRKKH